MKKTEIEAIYPLTAMQQGLLFHHLTNSEDQGFILAQGILKGKLNINVFKESWGVVSKRHSILRTSVHWKNIHNPILIVRPDKNFEWTLLNWTDLSRKEQEQYLVVLKKNKKERGVNLEKAPLAQITMIQIDEGSYYFLWSCHHLLLDGWSSSIILKDLLTIYDALCNKTRPILDTLPSYKSYLNWINKMAVVEAADFWSNHFKDFKNATLFNTSNAKVDISKPAQKKINLSNTDTDNLLTFARNSRVTINTIVQGVWSLVLSRYFGTNDITYGVTVSGRSGDFPNIDLLTGMFMNMQPVRNVIADGLLFSDWFKSIQKQQQDARKHEHISLDQITSFIDWPTARPLFDSLLIFENYPVLENKGGAIEILNFKSELTSTFPVTMVVVPGKEMEFILSTFPEIVDEKSTLWILDCLAEVLDLLASRKALSYKELKPLVSVFERSLKIEKKVIKEPLERTYIAPKNEIELRLVKIWENLFGIHPIGTNDDFFEIGGKSLLAAKMFSVINGKMNVKLPPTNILENPTIEAIARLIDNEGSKELENWKNLVPIRAKGSKQPLFCLHAGGGHVFFYRPLTNYMDENRPIYALQPSGIYGNGEVHKNIEEMAIDYVKEIRTVCPEGPYNLLVYCFSTAVGFEMVNLLKKMGQKANLIVMDTMAEQEHLTNSRITMRILGFAKRFLKNPFKVISTMISDRVFKYVRPFWINMFGTIEEKNTSNIARNLLKIYNKYQWKSYKVNITLVLTKKVNERFNKELLSSWEKITDSVSVLNTQGDHRTLFEEPDVEYVAKTLEEYLE